MRLMVFAALGVLAGCAGQAPQVEVRTVTVEVPVAVPCEVKPVAEPAFAATTLKRGDSDETKVRALLAERRQRIGYEIELKAAAAACSK